MSFLLVVPLFVICCRSLSFVVIRCHSLPLVVPLVVIRCTTHCHSLPLVVTRCTSRLSFYKRSGDEYQNLLIFIAAHSLPVMKVGRGTFDSSHHMKMSDENENDNENERWSSSPRWEPSIIICCSVFDVIIFGSKNRYQSFSNFTWLHNFSQNILHKTVG